MKFIGTTEELKRKYGRGFSLLIKLIETHEESEEIRDEKIQGLKSGISIKFKKDSYVLKEESKVYFHLSFLIFSDRHLLLAVILLDYIFVYRNYYAIT